MKQRSTFSAAQLQVKWLIVVLCALTLLTAMVLAWCWLAEAVIRTLDDGPAHPPSAYDTRR